MRRPSGRFAVALGAIVVLGAALRWFHLDDQSVWFDEASSLTLSQLPLGDLLQSFRHPAAGQPLELNPPVYFVILHGWLRAFGAGGLQARLLSAAAGVLSLPLLYLLGRGLFDAGTGLRAALILAVSQLGVMYSQEARSHELVLLFSLATAYCFHIARTRHQ